MSIVRFHVAFPTGTPWVTKLVAVLFFGNAVLDFTASWWAERYAPTYPDAAHPYAMVFKGGRVAYVPTWLGYYDEWGFWAHFILLALFGLTLWWHVHKGRAIADRSDLIP